jgi:hypothetical protein
MPRKNMQYSKATLEVAVQAIKSGEMTANKASKVFNIPTMTLYNKKNNRHTSNSAGGRTKLSKADEDALQTWILERADKGFPVNSQFLRMKAGQLFAARMKIAAVPFTISSFQPTMFEPSSSLWSFQQPSFPMSRTLSSTVTSSSLTQETANIYINL